MVERGRLTCLVTERKECEAAAEPMASMAI
jgi:hypothetical protein